LIHFFWALKKEIVAIGLLAFISVILGSAQVYASETITIRSGNGVVGNQDSEITVFHDSPSFGPFTQPIEAVCNDLTLVEGSTSRPFIILPRDIVPLGFDSGPGKFDYKPHLDSDTIAKWISTAAENAEGGTALYSQDFTLGAFDKVFLEFDFLVDNELGDADDVGLLINCQPVDPSAKLLGEKKEYFQIDQQLSSNPYDITSLVSTGKNILYVYTINANTGPAGIQYSAEIKVESLQSPTIPDWIRNNAKWWSEGAIADSDFISGIEYLIKENIISIPNLPVQTSEIVNEQAPEWVRNVAAWWADGLISDTEFVSGIKYLVEHGIIKV